jgi:Predicted metal-dependent hydrolase
MSKYVELGYPIYEGMPVYPGLPEVKLTPREQIEKGDYWNGTILSIYLHAGTHVDAPWHYVPGAIGIDQVPIDNFIYKKPMMIYSKWEPNHLISIEEIKAAGQEIYEADVLFFNTGHWKYRENDFDKYKDNFPAVSPEAAEFIRQELLNVKAVAIDTLSIENIQQGMKNGFRTHNAFLNPNKFSQRTLLIYEDYNPAPIDGKKIIFAMSAPLRIRDKDASVVNIIAEIE